MANRHKAFKKGGKVLNAGGNPNVEKEAKEKNRGGSIKRAEGGAVPGFKRGGRLDKKARGGSTGGGSDKNPFSSAHRGSKKG